MEIKQYLTDVNFNKGNNRKIKYIVLHYTGNKNDTALSNCKYFKSVNRNASAHYFIDENNIYQCVKDEDVAWAVGRDFSKGTAKFRSCTNANSISIEMCNSYDNVPTAIEDKAVELTKYLMDKYNISVENVIRHYDCCGKVCPRPWVNDESKWNAFKAKLTTISEEDSMIQKLIEKYGEAVVEAALVKLIETEVNKETVPAWAEKEMEQVKAKGITDGARMGDYATRLEVALMTNRVK